MPLRATTLHGVSIPCLVPLTAGGTRPPIILADSSIVIGSGDAAQIRLKSLSVSKAHALLLVDGAKAYVRDLASRTELFVNDRAVRETWLKHGDVLRVGRFGFGVVEDASLQGRPAGPPVPDVVLRVEGETADRRVGEPVVLIGRRAKCDVSVSDEALSGAHAILFRIGARWYLRDLSSRTGTFVNGTPVRQQRALAEGDLIRAGRTEMRFLGDAQERAPRVSTPAERVERVTVQPAAEVSDVSPAPLAESKDVRTDQGHGAPRAGPKTPDNEDEKEEESVAVGAAPPEAVPAALSTEAPPVDRLGVPPTPAADADSAGSLAGDAGARIAPSQAEAVERVADTKAASTVEGGAQDGAAAVAAPLPATRRPNVSGSAFASSADDSARHKRPAAKTDVARTGASAAPPAIDDSALGIELDGREGMGAPRGLAREGRAQGNPSDTEWEQAVTVWSFEDLARRSSGDQAEEEAEPSAGRRLVWAAVAAGLVVVGVLGGVLAYKML